MIRAGAILAAVLVTAPTVVRATEGDPATPTEAQPPSRLAILLVDERTAAIATGIDVAVESGFAMSSRGKQYSALKTLRDIGINSSDLALDSKTDAVVRELRMIGEDIDTLEKLHEEGVSLNKDPRARALIDKMFDRRDDLGNDGRAFYRRAMRSGPGLYNTVLAAAMEVSFQAGGLNKRGKRTVKNVWRDGEKLARGITGSKWKQMNARAKFASELSDKLLQNAKQELIDEMVKKRMSTLIRERLDALYAEATAVPRGRRLRPGELRAGDLRVMYGLQPHLVAPLARVDLARVELAQAARPVELARAAIAPVALARPVQAELARPVPLARAADPVVQMIVNEDVVHHSYSGSSNYDVETRHETVHTPASSRVPDIDLSKYSGSSWTGASGSSLKTRW